MKVVPLSIVLLLALAQLSFADPMRDPKNIPNLSNFKWTGVIYTEGNVTVYRGQSKEFLYTEHLGVWNNSGEPVKLTIAWIGFDDETKRTFQTELIPSSKEPRITLIHTSGFKDAPTADDNSVAFKELWINGTSIDGDLLRYKR